MNFYEPLGTCSYFWANHKHVSRISTFLCHRCAAWQLFASGCCGVMLSDLFYDQRFRALKKIDCLMQDASKDDAFASGSVG